MRQERLYFFQFPHPFPTFISNSKGADAPIPFPAASPIKRVSFAPDSKPPHQVDSSTGSSTPTPSVSGVHQDPKEPAIPKLDGVIGQLEVRRSGAVTMRFANGIVLDVSTNFPLLHSDTMVSSMLMRFFWLKVVAATQPTFLQHAAHVDLPNERLSILGEVNKRFVVSPNVEGLLAAMEKVSNLPVDHDGPAKMDTT